MSAGAKVVLLACGSFNPPTFMHLRMFELARDHLQGEGVSVVGGVISPVHDAYGKKELVAAHHRCAMVRHAVRSSGWVRVSAWETESEGWSRTRLVLDHHQRVLSLAARGELDTRPAWLPDEAGGGGGGGGGSDQTDDLSNGDRDMVNNNVPAARREARVRLLCGADLLDSFATPGLWSDEDLETIVGQYGLVVVSRAGSDSEKFVHESDVLYKHRHKIALVRNWVRDEVSSTALRRLLRRGHSVKYLTDDAVAQYARAHRLYRPAPAAPATPATDTEYSQLHSPSPTDVPMLTPAELNYKNVLLSIREPLTFEKPKRPRANYILPNSHTDSVSPECGIQPKMAYMEPCGSPFPGKAVKVVPKATRVRISEDEVSLDETDDRMSLSGLKKSLSEVAGMCASERGAVLDRDGYMTRSCNDVVKLVLTKYGIHVISDTEALV